MILNNSKLDQVPTNIQIVDSNGVPTQAFVFYLMKLLKKSTTDNTNFDTISGVLSEGITTSVTLMDSPTTYKTLHFTDGLLTSVT